jgi:transmembrane sensor
MERECLAWQARSAAHRVAFERCTDTWQEVPGLTRGDAFASAASERPPSRRSLWDRRATRRHWTLGLAVAMLVLCGAAFTQFYLRAGVYSTGVGEQQSLVLEDGTRLTLNTTSRVNVKFDAARRNVNVEDGEALFEVAKDPRRPFVVRANGNEVVALGTVFSVRFEPSRVPASDKLAVMLIEGQVTVHSAPNKLSMGAAPSWALTMKPGERVRVIGAPDSLDPKAVHVDRPSLESVVAWKRHEAVFDDVSLSDAVAELNRYNRTPIVLVDAAALGKLRVSGVYRLGDAANFAQAVAALHGLNVHERLGRLELTAHQ